MRKPHDPTSSQGSAGLAFASGPVLDVGSAPLMELAVLLGVLAVIIVIATPIAAFIAVARTSALRDELGRVRSDLSTLRRWVERLQEEDAPAPKSRERPRAERAEASASQQAEAPVVPPPGDVREEVASSARAEWSASRASARVSPRARPDAATAAREQKPTPLETEAAATSARPREAARSAVDFETHIGTTWLLRIGLGVLGIALALFARELVPQLPAAAKVALAYGGAGALFFVGKVFEVRLERFARPVMAAGLTFGFFVAYAAHFVPAMRAVPLAASMVWMTVSMIVVIVAAERWTSQMTGVLAIVLGHVAVLVAAGEADIYALIMIAFLAVTAVALVLRHEWPGLGLFAVAASYGSHMLWLLTERDPIAGELGFWLNLAFLTSYYAVFLTGDVLWWRRDFVRDDDHLSEGQVRTARQIGPANVMLYVGLVSFVYVATGAGLEAIEWFYLTLGVALGALASFYWSIRQLDFAFYPAFGTVLWTLGMFAALDALALNLVLAAQALLLLLAAHQTKLWVFHALAQLALGVAFVHYLVYPAPATPTIGLLLGGLGIAGVYLLKASLEEVWYGEGTREEWIGDVVGSGSARMRDATSDLLTAVAPYLASAHAALGGFVVVRELLRYYGSGREAAIALVAVQALVGLLALFRRRSAVLFAVTAMAVAIPYLVAVDDDGFAMLLLLNGNVLVAWGLALLATRRLGSGELGEWVVHAQAVVALAIVGAFTALTALDVGSTEYLPALTLPMLVFVHQEMLAEGPRDASGYDPQASALRTASALACIAASLAVVALTVAVFKGAVAGPVWIASWAALIALVSGVRRSVQLFLASYALLVAGYASLLESDPVFVRELLETTWAGGVVVGVPLMLALVMDRLLGQAAEADEAVHPLAAPLTYVMYAIGLVLLAAFAHHQMPMGWSLVAPAAVGVGLVTVADRARLTHVVPMTALLLLGLHGFVTITLATGPALDALLIPLLVLCVTTWVGERLAGNTTGRPSDLAAARVRVGLVAVATWTAMLAVYQSGLMATRWVTAGWSVLGVALMIAGFGFRSSVYRRVALIVLGVSLVRVFAVDTRGLSDTERTVAFFVLGISLVGAAWLYARYADELKSWL